MTDARIVPSLVVHECAECPNACQALRLEGKHRVLIRYCAKTGYRVPDDGIHRECPLERAKEKSDA